MAGRPFHWLDDSPSTTYSLCYWVNVNGRLVRAGVEGGLSCMPAGMTPRADNTAPEMSYLSVGGEADHTNNPVFPVSFDYADRWSSPWSDRHFGGSAFFAGNPVQHE